MLRTRILSAAELFEPRLREDWTHLVQIASAATPFQTPEWQETWAKHYLGAKKLRAIEIREGEDLVGLYPLVRTRGPWRALRPAGIGPSDYLHPLVADEVTKSVVPLIREALLDQKDADLVDLHQLRSDKPLADCTPEGGVTIPQATCLTLDLPGTYDGYLGMLGKSLRYDVRKLDKTLFTTGKAHIQYATAEDVSQGMDVLFDQHKRRWRKRWQPGAFTAKGQRFHHEWASLAIKKGWLRLGVLHYKSKPIGAIYAMALGNTTYFYQAGMDPEFSSVSPGTLLVANTIRQSIEEGRLRFDFMRGDEGYKRRWKPQHALENRRLLVPTRGGVGRLGAKWNLKASEIEAKVRAKLERHASSP